MRRSAPNERLGHGHQPRPKLRLLRFSTGGGRAMYTAPCTESCNPSRAGCSGLPSTTTPSARGRCAAAGTHPLGKPGASPVRAMPCSLCPVPPSRQRDFDFDQVAMQQRRPRPSRTRPAATARPATAARPAAPARPSSPRAASAPRARGRPASAPARPAHGPFAAPPPPPLQLPPRRRGAGQEQALGGRKQDVAQPPRPASRWRFAGPVREKRPEWC